MKRLWLLSLIALCVTACAQVDPNTRVDADKFETGIQDKNVQVLDVRTESEFQSGHIKDAMLANWNNTQQFRDRVQYIDKDKPVYVYCLVGGRSAAAATWMRQNGYKNVIELQGGINAWKKAGKALENVTSEKQMTIEEYKTLVSKNKIVLADIGADWCPPCIKMKPVIDSLQKDNRLHFELVKIDAGIHTDVLKELNIDPIPVFIIYKDGKEVWRKEGIASKEELAAQIR